VGSEVEPKPDKKPLIGRGCSCFQSTIFRLHWRTGKV